MDRAEEIVQRIAHAQARGGRSHKFDVRTQLRLATTVERTFLLQKRNRAWQRKCHARTAIQAVVLKLALDTTGMATYVDPNVVLDPNSGRSEIRRRGVGRRLLGAC